MRAGLQAGGFQVCSSSILLIPMPQLCGIFSNSVLPSRSGRQQGQHNILYYFAVSNFRVQQLEGRLPETVFFYYFMFNLYEVILFVVIKFPPE